MDYYVQMVQKLKQQVGEGPANQLLSEAVYLFNIAGNDYVTLLQKNVKKLPLSNFKKKRQLNMIIGNLTIHIKVRVLALFTPSFSLLFMVHIFFCGFFSYTLNLRSNVILCYTEFYNVCTTRP